MDYHSLQYKFQPSFLKEVYQLKPWITYRTLFFSWLGLFVLIKLCTGYVIFLSYFWIGYPILAFVLASRQGVLLNLMHEGAHSLICRNKVLNDGISKWLCGLPIGVDFDGHRFGHRSHHSHSNTEKDPPSDTEKYKQVDIRNAKFYLLLIKDILGVTALQVFLAYNTRQFDLEAVKRAGKTNFALKVFSLLAVQSVILGLLFSFDLRNYALFWVIPAMTAHMVLMRIRGIAEHGLPNQLGELISSGKDGSNLTRSFLTRERHYSLPVLNFLERFLIGSVNIGYHHEHHALPTVPFYNLPRVHEIVSEQLMRHDSALHGAIYERGYFTAFFVGLLAVP